MQNHSSDNHPDHRDRFYDRWKFPPQFPHRPGEHGLPIDVEDHPEDVLIESICGGINDSQPVEQYDGTLGVSKAFVRKHERPVGQIQWNDNLGSIYDNPGTLSGVRWCSGALITETLFLTAGHCFDKSSIFPKINGTSDSIPPEEAATNMHVNFNFQVDPGGTLRQEVRFGVDALVEYRLDGLDYAVIRLRPHPLLGKPGKVFSFTLIANGDANIGDMLCIIQHPQGLPKRIEAGPLTDLHGGQLGYNDIDTLGGSSGSGILNLGGKIVGVHTNGGCSANAQGHNHGTRISSIIAASPLIVSILNQNLQPPMVMDDILPVLIQTTL